MPNTITESNSGKQTIRISGYNLELYDDIVLRPHGSQSHHPYWHIETPSTLQLAEPVHDELLGIECHSIARTATLPLRIRRDDIR